MDTSWHQKILGNFLCLQRGFDLPKNQRISGDFPIVSSSGISDFHAIPMVKAPGVVTGRYGTIGEVFYIENDFWPLNTTLFVSDFKGNNELFTAFLLRTIDFKSFSEKSGVPGVNRNDLHTIQISYPDPPEQKRIAEVLSDVDKTIAALDRLIAKKRDIKTATMQQLLTGKTRLPGFSGEWVERKLGDLASMESGGTPKSSINAYYGGNIPWVSISDMTESGKVILETERTLTDLGLKNSSAKIFSRGTILYAMYASLGECSLAGIPLSSSQAILGIKAHSSLDMSFLYYYLCFLRSQVKAIGQQGTQSNLNKGMVQNFDILLPDVEEQKAIAQILSDIDEEIETLEKKRNKYKQIKQGMMQELLTGRTRLPLNPDPQP